MAKEKKGRKEGRKKKKIIHLALKCQVDAVIEQGTP